MMANILIGSHAAKHWFPDFPRDPVDTDYVGLDATVATKNLEVHYGPAFDWLLKNEKGIASPNALYTIKLSHAYWDIWWNKTMFDIQFFQMKNCTIIEEFYQLLYQQWLSVHANKPVNLNKSNDDFFKDQLVRQYNHDDLHRWVAYGDKPYHEKLKKDPSKALLSKSMFFALPYEEQLKVCREEIYVITLERYLIPSDFKLNYLVAYRRALKDLIVRMTKGWFSRFLVENYRVLKNMDDHNFVALFQLANKI